MGYTKKGLQEQLAIARRELADTERYIARHEKALTELRASEDALNVNIEWLEGQLNPQPADKFAQRDESPLVKKQPKSAVKGSGTSVYDFWKT